MNLFFDLCPLKLLFQELSLLLVLSLDIFPQLLIELCTSCWLIISYLCQHFL